MRKYILMIPDKCYDSFRKSFAGYALEDFGRCKAGYHIFIDDLSDKEQAVLKKTVILLFPGTGIMQGIITRSSNDNQQC